MNCVKQVLSLSVSGQHPTYWELNAKLKWRKENLVSALEPRHPSPAPPGLRASKFSDLQTQGLKPA